MIQGHSSDGVRIYQDPGVRIVVDGQLRGLWDDVSDWASDVVDGFQALPGMIYHSPSAIKDSVKLAAKQGCKVLVSDDVRSVANYCAAAILVPGPQQAEVVAACAAYQAAALACGLAFPQMPPIPQGTTNTGPTSSGASTQQQQALQLLMQNQALRQKSLVTSGASAPTPWYAKGSTYAVAGGVLAAVGGAYYFARVRR